MTGEAYLLLSYFLLYVAFLLSVYQVAPLEVRFRHTVDLLIRGPLTFSMCPIRVHLGDLFSRQNF